MSTKIVQVIKEYSLCIATNVEIPIDSEVKDVYVKWDNMEVITTNGVFTSVIDLTEQEIDYKRPFRILVFEENGDPIWDNDPGRDYSMTQDISDAMKEDI